MKYVCVQHKPDSERVFWFVVPQELSKFVHINSEVLCDTRKGKNKGTVIAVMDGITEDGVLSIAGFDRKYLPMKNVLAVEIDAELKDIHIPYSMEEAPPSAEKIAKRVNEFYANGMFETPVIFTPDMNLQDGYTAYLVATMFGHATLHGFCMAI